MACVQEAANPVVEERIKELLRQGVKSVSEMRRCIRDFVKSNLYSGEKPLPLTRYRYYTLPQNLRNIMKTAQDAAAHLSGDQEKLQVRRSFFLKGSVRDVGGLKHAPQILVNTKCAVLFQQILAKTWRERDPDDRILVRAQREGEDFLLCYQTKWQQHLLNLYGQEICVLDATLCRTTQCELPLFFLWVRTNVCYVVVAVFIVQRETKESLSDVLQLLKSWNEGWSPGHFMVDFSQAQINAVESVFTGLHELVCFPSVLALPTYNIPFCNNNSF